MLLFSRTVGILRAQVRFLGPTVCQYYVLPGDRDMVGQFLAALGKFFDATSCLRHSPRRTSHEVDVYPRCAKETFLSPA